MPTDWTKIATTVAPLVIGAYAGHKQKQAAEKSSQGSRLQDLLPQIQAMLALQQQHSQQNYQQQQSQYAMTQPLNQSITSMANGLLPRQYQAGSAPQASAAPASAPAEHSALSMPSAADMEAGYQRRGGGTGGAWKGAANGAMTGLQYGKYVAGMGAIPAAAGGALIGGIVGAAKKHAKSAPTDFTVQDAHKILSDAHTKIFGQPAQPQDIESAIVGQGWQPGDRWVGEQGLTSIIRTWQQQAGH